MNSEDPLSAWPTVDNAAVDRYDSAMDEHRNPWTVVGSREVYANPWIKVREDQVVRPDGNPGIYGVVEFQNLALGIVPVDAAGWTYLVGQWRYPLERYSWEIPEGGGSLGTPAIESAQRELVEEAGIKAAQWIDLGPFDLSNSVTNETGRIYMATDLTFQSPEPEGSEDLRLMHVSLHDAWEMAMDGRITDAVSIIGLARACRAYRQGRLETDANHLL